MSKITGDFNWKESISLKEYFTTIVKELRDQCDDKLDDVEEQIDLKFAARDKALDLQSESLKTRLEALNEWRQQSKDERESFLTRKEYELKHELLVNKIEQLQKFMWIAIGIFAAIDYIIQFVK